MKISNKKIYKTRSINCSVDNVWWRWTTHEGLLTFLGADNKIELVPNGKFEIYFHINNPEGERGSEGCKVLSYIPKKMFSFTWNAPSKFPDIRNSDYHTWVVVNFSVTSEHETEVSITHLGWPEGESWNPVYEYFDHAWELVLYSLQSSCVMKVL